MKQFIYTILMAATVLWASACVDFDDATQATSVKVQLQAPEGLTLDLGDKTVTMQLGGQTTTVQTDSEGAAVFSNVVPDVYDLSVSWTITADEYMAAGGGEAVATTVSASLNSQLIAGAEVLYMQLLASAQRDIVIGKVYYAGSKDNNNRNYMAGKYIELYNQSDDTVDVSGLYIGLTESESTQAWTRSDLDQTYGSGAAVLLKQIYRIPTDDSYMVAPGGTVVICNSAIDHTDGNDRESDLTEADFEVKDTQGNYQNNPAVPAMQMIYQIYAGTSVMNLVQSGPTGVVIFRTDQDVTAWTKVYKYGATSGLQYVVCPTSCILDGMEALRRKTSGIDVTTKRLPDCIDAGYTSINAVSGWNAEVVYRRTRCMQSGHKVLVDTNNSSNDCQTSTTIKPRQYDDCQE